MGAAERHIAKHFGTDERTARRLLLAADRRQRGLISALTFVLAVLVVAVLMTALAALLLLALFDGAYLFVTIPLAILFSLVAAISLVMHMEAQSRAAAAIRVIDRARLRHECLHCGYDLRANLGGVGHPICPECGEQAVHLHAGGDPLP